MKKRFWALLLAVMMVVSVLPTTAFAATADEPVPSVSTPDSSPVKITKSVEADPTAANRYTLSMEAYVTGQMVSTNPEPLDIVLVLDVSGSMKDDISIVTEPTYESVGTTLKTLVYANWKYNDTEYYYLNGSVGPYLIIDMEYDESTGYWTYTYDKGDGETGTHQVHWLDFNPPIYYKTTRTHTISKMDALKNAVNAFITATEEKNAEVTNPADMHSISIVKFAGEKKTTPGNDMYREGDYQYNNTQIVKNLTTVNSDGANELTAAVNALQAAGATAADWGMEFAKEALKDSDRKQVVIFFTDGEPNHGNGFSENVANATVKTAKELKDGGATIYTIGVFAGADPTDGTKNVNKFMHAVSSNYPAAVKYTDVGRTPNNNGYYQTATTQDDLTGIFGAIAEDMIPDVTAGSTSVLTDTVSGWFTAPNDFTGVTVEVYQASGNGEAPVWTEDETFNTTDIKVTVSGQKISVTGFDYAANALAKQNGSWTGKKLVISFAIAPNAAANWTAGTNLYPTNDTDKSKAGLYSESGEAFASLDRSPTVPVTAYSVTYDANGGSFAQGVKHEFILLYGADMPTIATDKEPTRGDYSFQGWGASTDATTTVTPPATVTESVTYYAIWENARVNYTVKHYQQKLDGTGYELADTETKTGITGAQTEAAAKVYTGFAAQPFNQETINANGTTVVNIYYTRNTHTVTYTYDGDQPAGAPDLPNAQESVLYGSSVDVADALELTGYTFSGWSTGDATINNGSFSMPDKDVVLKGKFNANTNTAYKVEHYKQKLDGTGYDLADTENKTGTTGAPVTAAAKTYEGFTFDETVQGTIKSGTIVADGSLVLKLYYTRNTYTVTYKVGGEVSGKPATYKYGAGVTVQADASKPGYTFSGWSTDDVTINEGKFTMPANNVTIVGSFTKQCDVEVEKDVYQLKDAEGKSFYPVTDIPVALSDTPVAVYDIPAVKAGDTIIWRIVVKNIGDEAGSFTLTDLLPGVKLYNEQFQDVDPTSVAINGGQSITYYAEYKVTEADEAEIVNKVKVQSGSTEKTDEAPGVPVANISVTKKADKTSVRVGDKVTYTITVKNEGSVTLYDVKVTDEFTTGGKGSKVVKEGIWNVDELAPGESFVAKLIYTTVSSDTNGLKNTAVAEGTYDGQKTVDETATVDVTVKSEPITPVGPSKPQLNYEDHYAYVVGYPDGLVHPERNITRAEVATIFFRMLLDESREYFWAQENDFSDVAETDWFNNAVSTLANAQLINGYPDGSYRPNANITRAEFATIAIRFFLDEDVEIEGNNLSDVKGHWAEANINLAYALELINGYPDGTFRPDQKITRAEAMAIVNRVLKRAPEKDHLLKDMIEWPDNLNTAAWYYADVQEATNSHKFHMDKEEEYEIWTELLPVRDWVALEQEWSKANSSKNPGEVVDIKITTPEAGDNGLKLD